MYVPCNQALAVRLLALRSAGQPQIEAFGDADLSQCPEDHAIPDELLGRRFHRCAGRLSAWCPALELESAASCFPSCHEVVSIFKGTGQPADGSAARRSGGVSRQDTCLGRSPFETCFQVTLPSTWRDSHRGCCRCDWGRTLPPNFGKQWRPVHTRCGPCSERSMNSLPVFRALKVIDLVF